LGAYFEHDRPGFLLRGRLRSPRMETTFTRVIRTPADLQSRIVAALLDNPRRQRGTEPRARGTMTIHHPDGSVEVVQGVSDLDGKTRFTPDPYRSQAKGSSPASTTVPKAAKR